MINKYIAGIFAILFTVLSALGDSQGFLHASRIWENGQVNGGELLKSAGGYLLGILIYWLSLRFFNILGINSPEIQTVGWFIVTIVGVALFSREITTWNTPDQILGLIAVLSIGILMFRRGG